MSPNAAPIRYLNAETACQHKVTCERRTRIDSDTYSICPLGPAAVQLQKWGAQYSMARMAREEQTSKKQQTTGKQKIQREHESIVAQLESNNHVHVREVTIYMGTLTGARAVGGRELCPCACQCVAPQAFALPRISPRGAKRYSRACVSCWMCVPPVLHLLLCSPTSARTHLAIFGL